MQRFSSVVAALALAAAVLVPSSAAADSHAEKSLYQRIGGYDAIAAVVDDFLPRLLGDAELKRFFGGVSEDSAKKIRQHLVDMICNATGGPCLYLGRDMKTSHKGLGITASDWKIGVGHLVASLTKFQVPQAEQNELVAVVATLEKDIVEKP